MKKYLFGLFAIALAIGFSAFTVANKAKKATYVYFEFVGDNETDFQDAASWVLDNSPDIACEVSVPFEDRTACVIEVDQDIATTVVDNSTLDLYLTGLSIDTYSEMLDKQGQGIRLVEFKEKITP